MASDLVVYLQIKLTQCLDLKHQQDVEVAPPLLPNTYFLGSVPCT